MPAALANLSPAKPYAPTVYDVCLYRDGFAIVEVSHGGFSRSVLERGFECEAEADHRVEELLADEAENAAAAKEAAAEYEAAAYKAELRKLFDVVNAQGGYVADDDIAGQAGNRAINDVLAFIEAKAA